MSNIPGHFSFGGYRSDLTAIEMWKFDVLLTKRGENATRLVLYVKHQARDECFNILFASYRDAKIFGTGMPLTGKAAEAEIGRKLTRGEVLCVGTL